MPKILIVDDDIQITDLIKNVLAVHGYESVSVNDSSKAFQTAISIKPNLFILDLMMPEPNGFELCKMLRADPNFVNTPIAIITAMDDGDSRAIAYLAGANDYLTKPFDPEDLAARIKALIN